MKHEQRKVKRAPQIETRGSENVPHLVGYAAVFYREDDPGTQYKLWNNCFERVMSSAFDNVAKNDVRGLFNHDSDNILGRNTAGTMKLTVDEVGLRYDITLPNTQFARDIAESIGRGDIDGSSFAFLPDKEEWSERKEGGLEYEVRELLSVEVFDVGPVTYPAYQATTSDIAERSHQGWQEELKQQRAAIRRRQRRLKLAQLRSH